MKVSVSNENMKVLAIVVNLFMPGLGNIIYKQSGFGIPVFIGSLLLTGFYFLPLIPLLNLLNMPDNESSMLLSITLIIACGAWLVDMVLMLLSIMRIVKE